MLNVPIKNITAKHKHKVFTGYLQNGDYESCTNFANNYLKSNTLQSFYENIVRPSLYDIGELWAQNKISVNEEHIASAIIEMLLNKLYADIPSSEKVKKLAITSCVEKEFHQIGIKMVNDVFVLNGWETHFIGATEQNNELIERIQIEKPDLLAISVSLYFNIPSLDELLTDIVSKYPGLNIIVGGQAFNVGGKEILLKYKNVIYMSNLFELENYIKSNS